MEACSILTDVKNCRVSIDLFKYIFMIFSTIYLNSKNQNKAFLLKKLQYLEACSILTDVKNCRVSIDLYKYTFMIFSTIYLNSKNQNKVWLDFFSCVLNFSAKKNKNLLTKWYCFENYILNIIISLYHNKTS